MNWLFHHTRRNRPLDLILFAAIVIGLLAVLRLLPGPVDLAVSGPARVIDGDSIRVEGVEIRLRGIDAPELAQTCTRAGETWRCGVDATRALKMHLDGRSLSCSGDRRDAHGRLLAACRLGGEEVNRWMVELGWAVSYDDYPRAERAAKEAKRGLWVGDFERPRDWRKRHRGG